jgi:hypothetical protein
MEEKAAQRLREACNGQIDYEAAFALSKSEGVLLRQIRH